MKILVVDDDPDLLEVIAFALQQSGFLVLKAADGATALQLFEEERPDLAVLDINMPSMSGFELAERLRHISHIPLMMLTVRSEEQDQVRALELGADDYLTKPFSPRVLIARIRALLRRAGIEAEGMLTAGPLQLHVDELQLVGLGDVPVQLTPLEMRFMQLLFASSGRTVATERILSHVWGNRGSGNRQLLKQLVHRLRHKLDQGSTELSLLRTVPNAGYRLELPSGQDAEP